MAFESQEMGKRARAGRILDWDDLPLGVFKVRGIRDSVSWYGGRRIVTLERKGETTKVWACLQMYEKMDEIPWRKWSHLKLINYGVKRCEKWGHWIFDVEVMA